MTLKQKCQNIDSERERERKKERVKDRKRERCIYIIRGLGFCDLGQSQASDALARLWAKNIFVENILVQGGLELGACVWESSIYG